MIGTLLLGLAMLNPPTPTPLVVMTFNIRFATAPDGENAWGYRREAVMERIRAYQPDLLGVQEALASQVEEILREFPEYAVVGVGRDDGVLRGEFSAMFYRKDKLGMIQGGTRWVSPTPAVPGSLGPGASLPRVFAWAEFQHVSGARFLAMNTHLDHASHPARMLGTQQMRQFALSKPHLPAVAIGDFNCTPSSEPVQEMIQGGTFLLAETEGGPKATFNGFDPDRTEGQPIDLIFFTRHWTLDWARVDLTTFVREGRHRAPSDHWPVIAQLTLQKPARLNYEL